MSIEQDVKAEVAVLPPEPASREEAPYTAFTTRQKRVIIFMASLGAFFSPLAGNIYYPALNTLASDLHVSKTLINLTLTSYMIFQGLAPTLVASFSDTIGRRPCYLFCFVVYIAANIGLALQNSFAALIVLRCLQSTGSSSTGALSNAVIADVATSAERGGYIGYTFAGAFVGQSLGPVLGGLLSHFLGWRWIFWVLTILAVLYLLPYAVAVPETCRNVVGIGTLDPPVWCMNGVDFFKSQNRSDKGRQLVAARPQLHLLNPLSTLRVCYDKEAAIILFSSGMIFAGSAAVASGLPSQFQRIYAFNDLQIGLSFITSGVGSCLAAALIGKAADHNYRRHCSLLSLPTSKAHHVSSFEQFPIEAARLEVVLPLLLLGSAFAIAYGWLLQASVLLPGPLILLFFIGFTSTGAFSVLSTLLIDIHASNPGTASAASNLVRCSLGAGASSLILPLILAIGPGWAYTVLGLTWLAMSPLLVALVKFGPQWRKSKQAMDGRARLDGQAAVMRTDVTLPIVSSEAGVPIALVEQSKKIP